LKITIIGTGYVGLVSAACFAEMGNTVMCVDVDTAKVEALRQGRIHIHEPGLQQLVSSNLTEGRLAFTTSMADAVPGTGIFFVAVGTPTGEDGAANLQYVFAAAHELGQVIDHDCLVVGKSTVPVGTIDKVRTILLGELDKRGVAVRVEVASNPEFLKEGSAVRDFMGPERVIVGTDSEIARQTLRALYAPFTRNHERLLVMSVRDAEMTKYAANAMLATRISFMNEMAAICDKLGVDIENVRVGIGSDSRIGRSFLYAGCGYGGSCFPKDISALVQTAKDANVNASILQAVEDRNRLQKEVLFTKINRYFDGNLCGRIFGVWGLAFKPETDDLREASSLALIERLIEAGAMIKAYDPVAMENARNTLPQEWFAAGQLSLVAHQYDAVSGVDALALVTEWKPFRLPDFAAMKRIMRQPVIFDGRNQYDPHYLRAEGFSYQGIGR
jgi:UDPglucose 6-dehydrogenase